MRRRLLMFGYRAGVSPVRTRALVVALGWLVVALLVVELGLHQLRHERHGGHAAAVGGRELRGRAVTAYTTPHALTVAARSLRRWKSSRNRGATCHPPKSKPCSECTRAYTTFPTHAHNPYTTFPSQAHNRCSRRISQRLHGRLRVLPPPHHQRHFPPQHHQHRWLLPRHPGLEGRSARPGSEGEKACSELKCRRRDPLSGSTREKKLSGSTREQ
jgi:hypothetical protein